MSTLILGLLIFFGVHLVPLAGGLREHLIARVGANAYKGAFTLASLIGLVLIIWGYAMTRYGPAAAHFVYFAPDWGRHVTMALVLLAFLCFGIFFHKGRLKRILRHPMSIGVALWATGHLFANGDIGSVLLFGSFLAYALLDIVVAEARGRVTAFEPKPRHDAISIVAGLAAFAVFLFLHPYLIGVPAIR
jgi:uncharacterized membrane protein